MEKNFTLQSDNIPPGEQKGYAYYIKLVLIMGKVLYFSIFLAIAARAYYRLNRKIQSMPFFIVAWFLLIILMIPIYDLAVPHLMKVLYVMMLASSYGVFLNFIFLVRHHEIGGDPQLINKFKPAEIVFHIAYVVLFIVGFIPGIGTECRIDRTYPYLFVVNAVFCALQSLMAIYFYTQGFMRKDYLPLSSEDNLGAPQPLNASETGSPICQNLVQKAHRFSDDQRIRCFESQTKYYTVISSISNFGYFALALWGLFGLEKSSQIGCNVPVNQTSSQNWIFYQVTGSVFITLHIVVIIVQTASINSSLYKVPKSFGAFDEINEAQ